MSSSRTIWLSQPWTVHGCIVHGSHKFHFSVNFSLKIGLTVLFTHLKIISLQCFQFQFSISAKISSIQTEPKYRIPRSRAMLSPSLKAHSSARQLLVLPDPLVKPLTQFPSLLQSRPPSPTLPEFPRANPYMFRVNQPLGGFFPANLYEIFHRGMFVEAIQSMDFSCLTNTRPK